MYSPHSSGGRYEHKRVHLHILDSEGDYDYFVDTNTFLNGKAPRKWRRDIEAWAQANRDILISIWNSEESWNSFQKLPFPAGN